MRKLGLIMSGVMVCLGLANIAWFFMSGALTSSNGSPFFLLSSVILSFVPFVYFVVLFLKIKKNEEFDKTHRTTIFLLVLPSVITLIAVVYFLIIGIMSQGHDYGGGFILSLLFLGWGTAISAILSFVGFIIDSVFKKRT